MTKTKVAPFYLAHGVETVNLITILNGDFFPGQM